VNTPQKHDFIVAIQARVTAGEFFLSPEQVEKASQFAEILHRENQNQNLTRILGVEEFIDGHLIDVIELFRFNLLSSRVLDLGSGCGVPGLLAAAIDLDTKREWILCDSENLKCEFLALTAKEMNLKQVSVYSGRVESFIQEIAPTTIISRAVGTVDKIAAWISNCSTWNNLILFKSKGWIEEWKTAQRNKNGKKLTVTQIREYSAKEKYRVLVNLIKK
jgi:16S rRNA (guanine(527)-N(7))-methyltransferase RsmG